MQQIKGRSLEPDATDLGDEMAIYGYARVSTDDQDLTVQREALKAAGCEITREEKVSGGSREGRQELETLLAFLRPGDTLIVTKLDRLARSTLDMLTLITDLGKRGVGVRSLAERDIDTTTAAGKLMLTVFAAVAQFERERIKERQAEGIKKAKENGVYKGGKPRIDRDEVARLKAEGLNPTQISKKLGINRVTVYRLTAELEGKVA
jgi:DNA invertase Pin-like site-specific DNA recombinase